MLWMMELLWNFSFLKCLYNVKTNKQIFCKSGTSEHLKHCFSSVSQELYFNRTWRERKTHVRGFHCIFREKKFSKSMFFLKWFFLPMCIPIDVSQLVFLEGSNVKFFKEYCYFLLFWTNKYILMYRKILKHYWQYCGIACTVTCSLLC